MACRSNDEHLFTGVGPPTVELYFCKSKGRNGWEGEKATIRFVLMLFYPVPRPNLDKSGIAKVDPHLPLLLLLESVPVIPTLLEM